ncbi:hypothetical protein AC1031_012456 [Aphanomyces cochlioides]|nr:hypothetical protein AC1031_012456 [Aphanomyces cochlioides]
MGKPSHDLQELQDQCILPEIRDRAGAAAEQLQQDMVCLLKSKWSTHLEAFDSAWRMWAAAILKRPRHLHARLVEDQPPSNMLHLFRSTQNNAERRCERIQQSLTLAREVVQSSLQDYATLEIDIGVILLRVRSFAAVMAAKEQMIEAFLLDMSVPHVVEDLSIIVGDIPNMDDTQHAEED